MTHPAGDPGTHTSSAAVIQRRPGSLRTECAPRGNSVTTVAPLVLNHVLGKTRAPHTPLPLRRSYFSASVTSLLVNGAGRGGRGGGIDAGAPDGAGPQISPIRRGRTKPTSHL